MSLTDVAQGEVQAAPVEHRGHGPGALTASARALFAAVSGLLLTAGIGVGLWAVTPSSVGGPQQSLRAAVAAFAAGNTMTLTIGRAALTLPPLMITVVAVGLLAGIGGRGRAAADDRTGELTCTVAAAAVYAAVVTTAGVILGTPSAVAAEQWWRPFLLALAVVGTTVFFRGHAWQALVLARTPSWFPVAVRLGAAGAAGVLAAGAAAVVLGLAGSFGNASTVQTLAAPGPAAGFGMALLGVAYLPNAVMAGAGYATGVGFHIGAGSYSPFGSSPVELPAVSLLAAAPDGREASRVGMVLLLLPVIVALLLGRAAARRLDSRRERVLAVGTGAALAGLLVAMSALVAGGGITGGQWATVGAPPLLLGVATAALLGFFGAAVAGVARQRSVPAVDTAPGAVGAAADPAAAQDMEAGAEPGTLADAASDEGDGESEPTAEPEPERDAEPVADRLTEIPDPVDGTAATEPDSSIDRDKSDEKPGEDADSVSTTEEVPPVDEAPDSEHLQQPQQAPESGQVPQAVDPPQTVDAPQSDEAPESDDARSGKQPEEVGESATVPRARREEDVLADSTTSIDDDLVGQLRPRPQPRQVS